MKNSLNIRLEVAKRQISNKIDKVNAQEEIIKEIEAEIETITIKHKQSEEFTQKRAKRKRIHHQN